MRIGIDARIYGPRQTGIGNYVAYLIDNLAAIDKKNEYSIFLRKESFDGYIPHSSRHKKILAPYQWYSFKEQTLFLKKILSCNLDLFHFPHFNVPILYNKPFVVTIHDLTPKFIHNTPFLRKKIYSVVLRHAIKKSSAIIAPTQAVKNDILNYFSVAPSKIRVISEGIPLLPFVTKNLKLKTKNYILYVGVWREHKNLKGLIDAFKQLKDEGLARSLVIAGEGGAYQRELEAYWTKLGLEHNVIPVGFLRNDELQAYYEQAELVVLPSFFEGFGLVPLEALKAGTPVAVSDIPALKEVLADAAFFFNPRNVHDIASTIKNALFDKNARTRKLKSARALLPRYSWEENAKKTLEIYEKSSKLKVES